MARTDVAHKHPSGLRMSLQYFIDHRIDGPSVSHPEHWSDSVNRSKHNEHRKMLISLNQVPEADVARNKTLLGRVRS